MSRKEAKAKGLTRYYTGKPCKHGHVAERLVSGKGCVECRRTRDRVYTAANDGRKFLRHRAYRAANPGKVNAVTAQRRANKLRATPPWLTQEQIRRMAAKYAAAKRYAAVSGIEWHVDHIAPLQGEQVCGLHVPWNLQVIPAIENVSKGSKLLEAA